MRLAAFLMFVQAFGTLLYTEQATIVRNEIVGEMARTEFFASIDFYSQSLTLLFQLVIAGWVMRRLGIAFALVLLPVIYFSSLVSLSLKPELIVLAVVMIVTRSCAYGMTVPAREVLFTVVSREDKYKAKNFIDTVVVRGGDSISMQFIGLMTSLGVTASAIRLGALPLAILWAILAWNLGKKQSKMDAGTLGS
jgi:AAA family ATP:ADP antiporter